MQSTPWGEGEAWRAFSSSGQCARSQQACHTPVPKGPPLWTHRQAA